MPFVHPVTGQRLPDDAAHDHKFLFVSYDGHAAGDGGGASALPAPGLAGRQRYYGFPVQQGPRDHLRDGRLGVRLHDERHAHLAVQAIHLFLFLIARAETHTCEIHASVASVPRWPTQFACP